jgi:hypothetical protein
MIYVTAVEALRKKKKKDRMKLSLSPKLVEKLVWVPVIWFCQIFIPSYTFDGPIMPKLAVLPPPPYPNHLTLQIKLLCSKKIIKLILILPNLARLNN